MAMPHSMVHRMMGWDWDCGLGEDCPVSDWVGGKGNPDWNQQKQDNWDSWRRFEENRAENQGYSENKQGSQENCGEKQGSKEHWISWNPWWPMGRLLCKVRIHNWTCAGRNECAKKLFRDDEIGDAPNDAH